MSLSTSWALYFQTMTAFWDATTRAQTAWFGASLAACDKMSRLDETPQHAAKRAADAAARGKSKSWYRAPAATWQEVSSGFTAANPMTRMPVGGGLPNPWLANPFMPTAFSAPWAGLAGNPFAALDPFSMAAMQLDALVRGSGAFAATPGAAPAERPSHSAGQRSGQHSQGARSMTPVTADETSDEASPIAVASITLPDQTVYKLEIPLGGGPFWPWSSGFGQATAATVATIEHDGAPAMSQSAAALSAPTHESALKHTRVRRLPR